MKKLLAFILAFTMLSGVVAFAEGGEPVYTRRKSIKDEAWLWTELSEHSPNDIITAAVLSYFWRESQYRSDAVAGYNSSLHGYGRDLCQEVLDEFDPTLTEGDARKAFVKRIRKYGGYGLGQWCSRAYLEDLYDYACTYETSLGDARMQCSFIFYSLQKDEELWKRLCKCEDPEKAGRLVGIYYDGTQSGAPYIGYKAKKLYEKYHEEG